MENKAMGNLLTNVAVALFAGALGGVITLAATQRFAVTPADVAPAEINLPAGPVSVVAPVESDAAFEIISEPEPDPPMIQLKAAMDEAAAERSQLAATLVSLTRQIDELEADLINYSGRMAGIAFDSSTDARASSEAFPQGGEALDEVSGNGRRQGMDRAEQRYQNLLAAGIDEQTALQLQQRSDQYQLARLELFDRAAREGWTDSEQLSSELEVLDETQVDLREALGDEAYDRYLYQAGRPNRVEIASIITGSAADMAGLQDGDLVLSYAGERIYGVQDLQSATREGSRGEYVQVVYDRGGQSMSIDIPRGPLGVTLGNSRIQP